MTNYKGQEDLDPLISALLRGNNIESSGNFDVDVQALESRNILTIQQAAGDLALRSKELQHV